MASYTAGGFDYGPPIVANAGNALVQGYLAGKNMNLQRQLGWYNAQSNRIYKQAQSDYYSGKNQTTEDVANTRGNATLGAAELRRQGVVEGDKIRADGSIMRADTTGRWNYAGKLANPDMLVGMPGAVQDAAGNFMIKTLGSAGQTPPSFGSYGPPSSDTSITPTYGGSPVVPQVYKTSTQDIVDNGGSGNTPQPSISPVNAPNLTAKPLMFGSNGGINSPLVANRSIAPMPEQTAQPPVAQVAPVQSNGSDTDALSGLGQADQSPEASTPTMTAGGPNASAAYGAALRSAAADADTGVDRGMPMARLNAPTRNASTSTTAMMMAPGGYVSDPNVAQGGNGQGGGFVASTDAPQGQEQPTGTGYRFNPNAKTQYLISRGPSENLRDYGSGVYNVARANTENATGVPYRQSLIGVNNERARVLMPAEAGYFNSQANFNAGPRTYQAGQQGNMFGAQAGIAIPARARMDDAIASEASAHGDEYNTLSRTLGLGIDLRTIDTAEKAAQFYAGINAPGKGTPIADASGAQPGAANWVPTYKPGPSLASQHPELLGYAKALMSAGGLSDDGAGNIMYNPSAQGFSGDGGSSGVIDTYGAP